MHHSVLEFMASALVLSFFVFAPADAFAERDPDIRCGDYDRLWHGAATVGLGMGGTLALGTAGALIGDALDPNGVRGGELVSDGFQYGLLAGGFVGSVVGSVSGSTWTDGPCADDSSFAGTLIGATSAAAVTGAAFGVGFLLGDDRGDRFFAVALPSLFVAPAIGALIGYHLNYPEDDSQFVFAPMMLPGGRRALVRRALLTQPMLFQPYMNRA